MRRITPVQISYRDEFLISYEKLVMCRSILKLYKTFVEERSLQNKLERVTDIYEGDYLTKFSLSLWN